MKDFGCRRGITRPTETLHFSTTLGMALLLVMGPVNTKMQHTVMRGYAVCIVRSCRAADQRRKKRYEYYVWQASINWGIVLVEPQASSLRRRLLLGPVFQWATVD